MSWWRKIFGPKRTVSEEAEQWSAGARCRRKYQAFRELAATTAQAWQQWQQLREMAGTGPPPPLWAAFRQQVAVALDQLAAFRRQPLPELQDAAARLTAAWPPPGVNQEQPAPLQLVAAAAAPGTPASIPALLQAIETQRLAEMFCLSLKIQVSKKEAASLVTGRLVPILVLDLDGGLARAGAIVGLEDLTSAPFRAFLAGMLAIPWPKARPVDLKGFMSVVGVTSTTPRAEDQLKKISLALVARDYCNFSLCLGYHASTVEAFFAAWPAHNYLRFHYEGGAASVDRRIRRLRLIAGILDRLGFTVTIKADLLDALRPDPDQARLSQLLEVLGKLEVYTKQMDMVMTDDLVIYDYIADFLEKHCPPALLSTV